MEKTNFDLYLEEELRDPKFAERFKQAGEAWDVLLHITRSGEGTANPKSSRRKPARQQKAA